MNTSGRASIPATLGLAVLLISALAACAPAAGGATARVDYQAESTYVVPAGSTLYVVLDLPLEDAGLTEERVLRAGFNWIPLGIRGDSANAQQLVTLPPPEVPEDWEARIWQSRIVRERPLGEPEGSFAYRLEIEVRVDVPASAEGLVRRIRGQVRIEGGTTLPLDFLVRAE